MSGPLGKYHFLAWARRGVASAIHNPDQGSLPDRASLTVQLALTVQQDGATSPASPAPMNVQMFGPGDVVGIDPRHVIRTEPRNFTVNFEPNYLCGIEFDMPDFPWLFTPAAANRDRLRPWLALIALKPEEFTPAKTAPNPLPVIEVLTTAPLTDLANSWNWAHVQISGDTPLAAVMTSAPGAAVSRLLCPRRLDPETTYNAFLVPAYEIGRQAGLGQDVSAIHSSDPAWTDATAAPLTLPVYYQFQFHTSDAGDFELLVRRLVPRVLPTEVGQRPMDVSQPMDHVPSAGPPLGLEGALHSVSTVPTQWNDPDKTNFQTVVQTFISQPELTDDDPANPNPDDPVIVPPIYGRWHAAVDSVDRTQTSWIDGLNLDPRNRSAGGMGTQVVQGERTLLIASAWQQVAGVLRANQMLRQAQLARAALVQLYDQHFKPMRAETVMMLTSPLHAKVMASSRTIRAAIRGSRVPERMLSPAFRRVTRPRRRVGASVKQRTPLLARVNVGELSFMPAPKPPDGLVSIDQVAAQLATPGDQTLAGRWRWYLLLLIVAVIVVAVIAGAIAGTAAAAAIVVAGAVAAGALYLRAQAAIGKTTASRELRVSAFTPQAVASAAPQPGFQIVPAGTAAPSSGTGPANSAAARTFRSATSDLFTYIQAFPVDPPIAPALDVAALKTTLMTRLDPATTVPQRVQSLISLSAKFKWQPTDPIEPIMAAPEFPQAMYGPLRDLSPQYVLPGVDLVAPDTLGILVTNHAFIELYMVGLNHEMARQLLWNGYPTDQRGSYFRQFWDVSAYIPQAGDPSDPFALAELLKDIPPIYTWPKTLPLGEHPNRTDVVLNNVVLLVRGELFRRYPNAIVYAGKAKLQGGTRVLDETDERYPIFRGTLPQDITFLGFNLSIDDARGGTAQSPEGFFFVFQEQPSEPRFGLESTERDNTTKHWADLAWTNFGGGGSGGGIFKLPELGNTTRGLTVKNSPWRLSSQVFSMVVAGTSVPDWLSPHQSPARLAIIDDPENPDDLANNWGVNAAQTAYILLRLPFRVLVHADLMLAPT